MATWTEKATDTFSNTHDALQLVVDNLNKGQTQKLIKDEKVKSLLDHYEVNYDK